MRSLNNPQWVILLLISFLPILGTGCASFRTEQAPNAAVTGEGDTTVGVKGEGDTTVGVKDVDTTSVTVTPQRDFTIGGGTDSIALWLAIISLAVAAVGYPVHRKFRLWRENGKHNGDGKH